MPFLTLQVVTARNVNGESITHQPGTVLSDWELEAYARTKILEGSEWYRSRYEPLTDREAQSHRVRATQSEQPHILDNAIIPPPFNDYVGLHPSEIVARLKESPVDVAHAARRYEAAGMRREMITGFIHPSEKTPFYGYDEMDLRSLLEKFEILPDAQVKEAQAYEEAHQNRPAVITWERDQEPAEAVA